MGPMAQSPIPPNVVSDLLDKLSSDSDFREQFVGDPVSVLKGMGVDFDPAGLPVSRKLPSKDVIKANRADYQAKITGGERMFFAFFS